MKTFTFLLIGFCFYSAGARASAFESLGEAFQNAQLPSEASLPVDSFWGGKCVRADEPSRFFPSYLLFIQKSVAGDPIFGGSYHYLMPFYNRGANQDDPERYVRASVAFADYTLNKARTLVGSAYSALSLYPTPIASEWRALYRTKQSDGKVHIGDYRLRQLVKGNQTVWIVRVEAATYYSPEPYGDSGAFCYAWVRRDSEAPPKIEDQSRSVLRDPLFP